MIETSKKQMFSVLLALLSIYIRKMSQGEKRETNRFAVHKENSRQGKKERTIMKVSTSRIIPAMPSSWQAFAGTIIALIILSAVSLNCFGQTAPAVDDPRIEVRWLNQAAADEGKELGDVLGENSLNVVILAEGYVENEKESFFAFTKKESDFFIRSVPYRNRFNVFLVYLPSKESGVDDSSKGIKVDTALDGYIYKFAGKEITDILFRENFVPYLEQILQRKKDVERDFITICINYTGLNDYATGYYAVIMPNNKTVPCVLSHELGHLIGSLSDHYWADGLIKTAQEEKLQECGGKIREIGLFGDASLPKDASGVPIISREMLPWAALIDSDVPVPTIPARPYFGRIGCFGSDNVLFTSDGGCIMDGSTDLGFCLVCQHAWAVKVLSLTTPFQDGDGEGGAASGAKTPRLNLIPLPDRGFPEDIPEVWRNITRLGDSDNPYDYEISWLVDGVTVPEFSGKTELTEVESKVSG
ncbi:MAG: M64 family metallopeptidase, partial [Candidatus Pacebacteria bacterium]|nr:M64 family metallopeptidase [Candidatus Paceibacterota bacterium]